MKYTKRQAAYDTWQVWSRIAELAEKETTFTCGKAVELKYRVVRQTLNYEPHNGCPCCNYFTANNLKFDCDKCVLIKLWPSWCMDDDSAYVKYKKSTTGFEAADYAKQIAAAALELYEALSASKAETKNAEHGEKSVIAHIA